MSASSKPARGKSGRKATTAADDLLQGGRNQPVAFLPALFDQRGAWSYLAVSRSHFFRLKSLGLLPPPVFFPDSPRPYYRRSDLDRLVESLQPR